MDMVDLLATEAAILIVAAIVGLAPAVIAAKKGRSFLAWWIFGGLLFIVALPLVFFLEDKTLKKNPGMWRGH
jgi:hypothetical protein